MAVVRGYRFGKGVEPEEVKRRLASVNPHSFVQIAKAGTVSNELVLEMLAAQTLRAESTGGMLAKKPEVDLLLRLSGTTQISKAIRTEGAARGKPFIAINAGREGLIVPAEFIEAELPRKRLTEGELARIERAALLDAQRG